VRGRTSYFLGKLAKKSSKLLPKRGLSGQGRRWVALGQPTSLGRHPWSLDQKINSMGLKNKVKGLE